MFLVGYLTTFMENPTTEHWATTKRILRYVKWTLDLGLVYKAGDSSTKLVGLSFAEAEYVEDTTMACQGIWLARLTSELMNDETVFLRCYQFLTY